MRFIMPRNRVVSTTLGHSIEFKKGEPTQVPPALYDIVQQHGAVPEEELPEDTKPQSKIPTDPAERSAQIQTAIELLVLRNSSQEFTAGGAPHAKVLSAELGWPVDASERDVEWVKFQRADGGT